MAHPDSSIIFLLPTHSLYFFSPWTLLRQRCSADDDCGFLFIVILVVSYLLIQCPVSLLFWIVLLAEVANTFTEIQEWYLLFRLSTGYVGYFSITSLNKIITLLSFVLNSLLPSAWSNTYHCFIKGIFISLWSTCNTSKPSIEIVQRILPKVIYFQLFFFLLNVCTFLVRFTD